MQFRAQILSTEEQSRIHEQSLRILESVGLRFHGHKALPILRRYGAQVDEESKIVKIPRALVEQALAAAPKSVMLGARNPRYNHPLPSTEPRYCMDGTAAFAQDFETGERRYGTRKDIENGMRIFQELDLGVMAWPPVTASDAPAGSRALHEFLTMAQFCSKHGQHELHTSRQVPYLVEGLTAILGGEDEFRQRKAYSLIYCPVAPLTHDGEMLDAYLELGEFEMPVMIMPMPVPGSTGPASLFANLSLANAEALSSIVVFQLAHPGRPLIYSSAVGTLDFSSGGFLGGTAEMGLMSGALTEIGHFYNLPTTSAGCTADAKEPGAQAVLEKLITIIPPLLARSDIIVGFGEIEGDQLQVLEQYIVDNEIAHHCQRLFEGIDTAPEKELFEDIARVGPGGHFLTTQASRRAPRSGEFYISKLLDRHTREAWLELGKPSLYTNARQKVQEILASPQVDPLTDKVIGQIEAILNKADKELT